MNAVTTKLDTFLDREYEAGFVTEVESDTIPKGLSEDTIRLISARKHEPEFMLEWRLQAYRRWLTMPHPEWAQVHYPPIDFQDIAYYPAPKKRPTVQRASMRSILSAAHLREAGRAAARACAAGRRRGRRVLDSASVATTFSCS